MRDLSGSCGALESEKPLADVAEPLTPGPLTPVTTGILRTAGVFCGGDNGGKAL